MTTMNGEDVAREPYIGRSSITLRSIDALPMPNVTSIVFVVDDDVSVRESLELLIKSAGCSPNPSSRHGISCPTPAPRLPAVWCST